MSSFHSYPSIFAMGHRAIADLLKGDVLVEEKIDGSQFSFGVFDILEVVPGECGILDVVPVRELKIRSKGATMLPDAPEKMFTKAVESVKERLHFLRPGWTYRGEYLCLAGDTKVKKASGGQNAKYVTLEALFHLQSKLHHNRTYKRKDTGETVEYNSSVTRWQKDGNPSLYSLNTNTDIVVKNRIKRVIHSGVKEVVKVTTRKGFSIKTTKEHEFWTPYGGWLPIGSLKVNDCVGVQDNAWYRSRKRTTNKEISALFRYLRLTSCSSCGITTCLEIHHIDGDFHNNSPENLKGVCKECHSHIPRRKPDMASHYEFDKITSMVSIGESECYDVEMNGEANLANFLAEGFIVHNCKPKHNALAYDRIPHGHIIIFDVNTGEEEYLDYEAKSEEAERIGLEVVPKLFQGRLDTIEQFRQFLGTTSILGGQAIEGVVVKPVGYGLYGRDKKCLMGKLVSEQYKEAHSKSWRADNPTIKDIIGKIGEVYTTTARWQKAIIHLREKGCINDDVTDIGPIIREVPEDVKQECEQEIKDMLFAHAWPHIRRLLTRGLPDWYKQSVLLPKSFEIANSDNV